LALCVALGLAFRLRKLRRQYTLLETPGGEKDIVAVVGQALQRLRATDGRIDELCEDLSSHVEAARGALQHFYIVRYDAFEDMGGRLSFSAALLDDHGDGVVITSINGRTETRTYAKPVRNQRSQHNLSDEEQEAIAGAMGKLERASVGAVSS
ncbi:MAG: DUF4446 family protein, partial [Actinomycetota bacterium]|nr:DUF4446 family protein [Actinomycetota bacterium]